MNQIADARKQCITWRAVSEFTGGCSRILVRYSAEYEKRAGWGNADKPL
jgi:hypothetical protein